MLKEVIVHKIVVALVVFSCKASVFVQVGSMYCRKIQIALFIEFNQVLVGSQRRRTGG